MEKDTIVSRVSSLPLEEGKSLLSLIGTLLRKDEFFLGGAVFPEDTGFSEGAGFSQGVVFLEDKKNSEEAVPPRDCDKILSEEPRVFFFEVNVYLRSFSANCWFPETRLGYVLTRKLYRLICCGGASGLISQGRLHPLLTDVFYQESWCDF